MARHDNRLNLTYPLEYLNPLSRLIFHLPVFPYVHIFLLG